MAILPRYINFLLRAQVITYSIPDNAKTKKPPNGGYLQLNSLFWRLATFASLRLSSPQLRLTSVFGMGTGVTIAPNHQNKTFDILFKSKSEIWAPQQTVVARL